MPDGTPTRYHALPAELVPLAGYPAVPTSGEHKELYSYTSGDSLLMVAVTPNAARFWALRAHEVGHPAVAGWSSGTMACER